MFDLLWDMHQDRGIQEAKSDARRAQEGVARVHQLEDRLDRLTLLNMALWSVLKERTGLTEEDLARRVQELDLADGRLDGKARPAVSDCPQCQRPMSQKHVRCMYCGFQPADADPFRGIAR